MNEPKFRKKISERMWKMEGLFAEAKQKLPFMKEADWGRPMLPVQLRFANSRG